MSYYRVRPVSLDSHRTLESDKNEWTSREVIDTAREITGCNIPVRISPRRPGDPANLVASSDKIHKQLGWAPKYKDLSKIIGSAWSWLQAHPDGYAK